jgi:hypothetical protein
MFFGPSQFLDRVRSRCAWNHDAAFAFVEHRALFWRIETPDNATGIVFGYARTAASVLPDIVRDGVRLIEQSGRVLIDMDNIQLPSVTTHEKMPPLVPMVSRPVSDELRKILAAQSIPQSEIAGLPGLFIAMVLLAEGGPDEAADADGRRRYRGPCEGVESSDHGIAGAS